VAAAALIAIGLTMLFEQEIGSGGRPLLLFLGLGFFAAYLTQREASDLIVPAGALTGLGLGIAFGSGHLTPGFLHAPIFFGGLALGFAAIYLLGEARHRWAIWPASAAALIAWLTFVMSAPWLKEPFGQAFHVFWPLALVAVGAWLIQRSRRYDTV